MAVSQQNCHAHFQSKYYLILNERGFSKQKISGGKSCFNICCKRSMFILKSLFPYAIPPPPTSPPHKHARTHAHTHTNICTTSPPPSPPPPSPNGTFPAAESSFGKHFDIGKRPPMTLWPVKVVPETGSPHFRNVPKVLSPDDSHLDRRIATSPTVSHWRWVEGGGGD